jgi:hypothetical protein
MSWTQIGSDINGEAAGNNSGHSVALSSDGTVMAIGAIYNGGNGIESGHVRVYKNVNNVWTKIGSDIDGESAYDYSGWSVALSSDGTIVAIGAKFNDGTSGVNTDQRGHVRVYKNVNNVWTKIGSDIDGEAAGNQSGYSVALSDDGTIVAIGAINNSGVNGSSSGHVRVLKYNGSSWNQLGSDIDGEASGSGFGYSVTLSSDGTIVAIGAIYNDGASGVSTDQRGHVRVLKYNGTSWSQLGSDIDGEAAGDYSGHSVALSSDGTIVAIGAIYNGGNGIQSGHVRVYKYSSSSWSKLGSDIDGEAAYDYSGWSVALSSDGTIVAIGAKFNDGTSGVSTNQRGHVRVLKYSGTSWSQLGSDIDGTVTNEESGSSVSLNSDGTIVAIGAPNVSSGKVRVYNYKTTPATPSISSVTVSETTATINFTQSSNGTAAVTSYKYATSTNGTTYGSYVTSNWASGTSFTVTNLTIGTTYYFKIIANNGVDSSESTASSAVTVVNFAPNAPTISSVTVSQTTATINFTAGSSNGSNAVTSYKYAISSTINGTYTFTNSNWATGTSFTVSGLTVGTTYYFKLIANNGIDSVASTASSAVTVVNFAPDAPTISSITVSQATATINFTVGIANGSNTVTSYKYATSTNGTTYGSYVTSNWTSGTSFTVTNLTIGTTYYFKIIANNGGDSSESSASSAVTVVNFAPATPTISSVTVSQNIATIDFTAGSSNGSADVIGYKYAFSTTGASGTYTTFTNTNLTRESATRLKLSGLTVNTIYYFKIIANNGIDSNASSASSAVTVVNFAPDAPTISSVTVLQTTATINFTQLTNGSNAVTDYKYAFSTNGTTYGTYLTSTNWITGTTRFDVSGLTVGSTYYFKLIANNGIDSVESSASSAVTVVNFAPDAPTISSVTVLQTTATINFTVGTANGSNVVTSYKYAFSTTGATGTYGSYLTSTNWITGKTSFDVSGLTPGSTYYFKIIANNGIDSSVSSVSSSLSIPDTPPLSPTISSVTLSQNIATINFTQSSNGSTAVTSYKYAFSTNGTTYSLYEKSNWASGTSFTVSGLTVGSTYYFKIIENNGIDSSESSASSAVTVVNFAPNAPTISSVTVSQTTATINFTQSSNGSNAVTSYKYAFSTTINGTYTFTNSNWTTGTSFTVSGLTVDTTYYFKIIANNGIDSNASSASSAVTVVNFAPNAPIISSVTVSQNIATINFTAGSSNGSNAVTSYKYAFSSTINGTYTFTNSNWVSGTSFTVSGLTVGSTYYFKIIANNGIDSSASSASSAVTVVNFDPNAPTISSVTVSQTTATIDFTQSSNGSAAIISYKYAISSTINGTYTFTNSNWASGTSFTVSGLTVGSTYYFKLIANNGIDSSASTASSAVTVVNFAPNAPTISSVTVLQTTATINFTAGSSNGSNAVTSYKYAISSTINGTYTFTNSNWLTGTTRFDVSGLTVGSTYYFKIIANNGINSSESSASSAVTVVNFAPNVPTNLSASISGTTATINFTPGSSNGSNAVTSYKYAFSTTGDSGTYGSYLTSTNWTTGATSLIVSGLIYGTIYYFKLIANNGIDSNVSESVFVNFAPLAPTNTIATISGTIATINFTQPTNGSANVTSYTYAVSRTGTTWTSFVSTNVSWTPGATSLSISSLSLNTTYYFRLKSNNGIDSIATDTIFISSPPASPTNLLATIKGRTATINFTQPTNGTAPVNSYKYAYSTNSATGIYSTFTNTNLTRVSATQVTISGLTNGSTYYFKLIANNRLESSESSASNAATVNNFPPLAPTNLVATISGQTATINFSQSTNGSDAVTSYTYSYSTDGLDYTPFINTNLSWTAGSTSLTISGLTLKETYDFKLMSNNGLNSDASNISNAVLVNIAPMAPTNLVATVLENTAIINFTQPSNGSFNVSSYTYSTSTNGTNFSSFIRTNLTIVSSTQVTISGLTLNSTYNFKLIGNNGINSSASSASNSITIIPYRPLPPANLDVSILGTTATIIFTQPNNGIPVTSYSYSFTTDGVNYFSFSNINLTIVSSTQVTISGLTNGQIYIFKLMSNNGYYNSIESQESNIGIIEKSLDRTVEQIGLDIKGAAASNQFGSSVSVDASGTIVAIGAPYRSSNGTNSGSVSIYKNINNVWTKIGNDINGTTGEMFGYSVTLCGSGEIVAIGLIKTNGSSKTGSVRVYKNINNVWTKMNNDFDISVTNATTTIVWGVSLLYDGTIMAIGSPYNNGPYSDAPKVNVGCVNVYLFDGTSNGWTLLKRIDGENAGDMFGYSVSLTLSRIENVEVYNLGRYITTLTGFCLAIGAPYNSRNDVNSGTVYYYTGTTNNIANISLKAVTYGEPSDNLGTSLSLTQSGSTIFCAVASPNSPNLGGGGFVKVFDVNNSSNGVCNAFIRVFPEKVLTGEQFGNSISLSGKNIVVGSKRKISDTSTTGIIRVFQYVISGTTGRWKQMVDNINSTEDNDETGCSLSLSTNDLGVIFAIGSKLNNGNGNDSGIVKVYNYYTSQLAPIVESNATASGQTVTINLRKQTNQTRNITGYLYSYSSDGNTYSLFTNTNLSWTLGNNFLNISGLTKGATYYFKLIAKNGLDSLISNASNKIVIYNYPPAAPIVSSIEYDYFDNNNIYFEFSTNLNGSIPDVKSYSFAFSKDGINYSSFGNGGLRLSGASVILNLKNIEGITPGYNYVKFKANNGVDSDASTIATRILVPTLPPLASKITSTSISLQTVRINFDQPIQINSLPIIGYKYDYYITNLYGQGKWIRNANPKDLSWTPGNNFLTISGLENTNSYQFYIWPFTEAVSSNSTVYSANALTPVFNIYIEPYWTTLNPIIPTPTIGSIDSISSSSDGTIVAIGSTSFTLANIKHGCTRVYKNVNNVYTQIGSDIYGKNNNVFSGCSVSLSGDGLTLAIGARESYDVPNVLSLGSVRIYKYTSSNNTWSLAADINGTVGDKLGSSVSLSNDGTTVAIGLPYNDGGGADSGCVQVYKNINNVWTKIGSNINGSAGDLAGNSVSINSDGTIVAIGLHLNDTRATNGGCVRVYKNINNVWNLLGQTITSPVVKAGSCFGYSVSLSNDGTILAIGEPFGNAGNIINAGVIRIYKYNNNSWSQLGSNISGTTNNDNIGFLVSLSGNGNTVSGTGKLENTTILYVNNNGVWTLLLNKPFVNCLSLNDDGTRLFLAKYNVENMGLVPGQAQLEPLAPVISNVKDLSNSTAQINFTQPLNVTTSASVTSYTYAYSIDDGQTYSSFTNTNLSWTPGNNFLTISGLQPNKTHYFRLKSFNGYTSDISRTSNGILITSHPLAPSITSVSVLNTTVTINFTQQLNNTASVTSYSYVVSTSINGTYSKLPNTTLSWTNGTTTLTISKLLPGSYYFKLIGNNGLNSPESVASNLVTINNFAPPAPYISSVTIKDNTATINFTQDTNGSLSVASYSYALSTNNGNTFSSFRTTDLSWTTGSTSLNINKLINGSSYQFKIMGNNGINSIESNVSNSVFVNFPPNPPTNLSAIGENTVAKIYFTQEINGSLPITNYAYSTDNVVFTPLPIKPDGQFQTTSPLSIFGLTNGQSYSFILKSINGYNSNASTTLSNVRIYTLAPAPAITSVSGSGTSIIVNFTQEIGNSLPITNYAYSTDEIIRVDTVFTLLPIAKTTSPITINGLVGGNYYSVTIKAVSGTSYSSASTTVKNVLVNFPPSSPVITSITTATESALIVFTQQQNGSNDITEYLYSTDAIINSNTVFSTLPLKNGKIQLKSPFIINNLIAGNTYSFTLKSSNGLYSNSSNTVTAVIPSGQPVPIIKSVISNGIGVTRLTIEQATNNSNPITNYAYSTDDMNWILFDPPQNSTTLTINLYDDTIKIYNFKLKSFNGIYSQESNTMYNIRVFFPSPLPPVITNISGNNGALVVNYTQDTTNLIMPIINYAYSTERSIRSRGSVFTLLNPSQTSNALSISGLSNTSGFITLRSFNGAYSNTTSKTIPYIMSTVNSATNNTVRIKQTNATSAIQFSTDNGITWNNIAWPFAIGNENSSTTTLNVNIESVLTLGALSNNNIDYFIINNNNITVNGGNYNININNYPNFSGLVKNGTTNTLGFNKITIQNIKTRLLGTTALTNGNGWICKSYFGNGTTDNLIQNCSSNGNISSNSGGISGQYTAINSTNFSIQTCSASGNIMNGTTGANAGGILGSNSGTNSTLFVINNCTYTGKIEGNGSGGIIGASCSNIKVTNSSTNNIIYGGGIAGSLTGIVSTVNSGLVEIIDCFTSGDIGSLDTNSVLDTFAGGIVADYAASVNITGCYSFGKIGGVGKNPCGGIIGAFAGSNGGSINITSCFSIQDIYNNCGGIAAQQFGVYSGRAHSMTHCYSLGEIGINAGGICGPNVAPGYQEIPFYNYLDSVNLFQKIWTVRDIYTYSLTTTEPLLINGINVFNQIGYSTFFINIKGCVSYGSLSHETSGGIIATSSIIYPKVYKIYTEYTELNGNVCPFCILKIDNCINYGVSISGDPFMAGLYTKHYNRNRPDLSTQIISNNSIIGLNSTIPELQGFLILPNITSGTSDLLNYYNNSNIKDSTGNNFIKYLKEAKYVSLSTFPKNITNFMKLIKIGVYNTSEILSYLELKLIDIVRLYPEFNLKSFAAELGGLTVLRQQGIVVADLKRVGYTLKELYEANAGYTSLNFYIGGFSFNELIASNYFTIFNFIEQDMPMSVIFTRYTIWQLFKYGINIKRIKNDNYSIDAILATGINYKHFLGSEYSINTLKSVFTWDQMKFLGYDPRYLIPPSIATIANISDLPFPLTPTIVQQSKVTAKMFFDAGYSKRDVCQLGYSVATLKALNFTPSDIRTGGYSVTAMKAAGYSDSDIKNAKIQTRQPAPLITNIVLTPDIVYVYFKQHLTNASNNIINYVWSLDGNKYIEFDPPQTQSPLQITGISDGNYKNLYICALNSSYLPSYKPNTLVEFEKMEYEAIPTLTQLIIMAANAVAGEELVDPDILPSRIPLVRDSKGNIIGPGANLRVQTLNIFGDPSFTYGDDNNYDAGGAVAVTDADGNYAANVAAKSSIAAQSAFFSYMNMFSPFIPPPIMLIKDIYDSINISIQVYNTVGKLFWDSQGHVKLKLTDFKNDNIDNDPQILFARCVNKKLYIYFRQATDRTATMDNYAVKINDRVFEILDPPQTTSPIIMDVYVPPGSLNTVSIRATDYLKTLYNGLYSKLDETGMDQAKFTVDFGTLGKVTYKKQYGPFNKFTNKIKCKRFSNPSNNVSFIAYNGNMPPKILEKNYYYYEYNQNYTFPDMLPSNTEPGTLIVNFEQVDINCMAPITNYAYSLDNWKTYTILNPPQTTSPLIIRGLTATVKEAGKISFKSYTGDDNTPLFAIDGLLSEDATPNNFYYSYYPPPTPTIASLSSVSTPTNGTITVNFTQPQNNARAINSYLCSTNGGQTFTNIGKITSPLTLTVANSGNFNVVIKAANYGGIQEYIPGSNVKRIGLETHFYPDQKCNVGFSSDASNTVAITLIAPPNPPVISSITTTKTTATINFTVTAGQSITKISYSIDNGSSFTETTYTGTSVTISTGLSGNKTYSFCIKLSNGFWSNASNVVSATTKVR